MSSNAETPNRGPTLVTKNDPSDTEDSEQPLPEHWTKMPSKKHPGKCYYFNSKTRESLWEHPTRTKALKLEQDIVRHPVGTVGSSSTKKATNEVTKADKKMKPAGSEKVVQLKNGTKFKKKNLAKDRMEAMQKQLAIERDAEIEKSRAAKKLKKEIPQKKTEGAKISSLAKSVKTPSSGKKAGNDSTELKNLSDSPSKDDKRNATIRSKTRRITKKSCLLKVDGKRIEATPEEAKHIHPIALPTKKQAIQFKIPKKPTKELLSSPLVNIQKQKVAKLAGNNVESNASQNTTETQTRDIPNSKTHTTDVLERKPSPIKRPPWHCTAPKLPEASEETLKSLVSTPKTETAIACRVSSEQILKSPANERLTRFREELNQEISLQSSLLDEDAEMTDLSDYSVNVSQLENVEEMDWDDVPEEVALNEVISIRRTLGFKLTASDDSKSDVHTIIPDYKTHLFDQVSFKRYFFMVVDTNIFLCNLRGVESLLKNGFLHIGQPIIIIPYIVLQELDRIKQREQGRPLSQAASRSIRFLNEHLKKRDPRVKGQSTIEAANSLIPIDNPDDNIINCCLQVRQIIAGYPTEMMLLTNDVNLRNKALVNGVQAFSFSELTTEADRIRFTADDCR